MVSSSSSPDRMTMQIFATRESDATKIKILGTCFLFCCSKEIIYLCGIFSGFSILILIIEVKSVTSSSSTFKCQLTSLCGITCYLFYLNNLLVCCVVQVCDVIAPPSPVTLPHALTLAHAQTRLPTPTLAPVHQTSLAANVNREFCPVTPPLARMGAGVRIWATQLSTVPVFSHSLVGRHLFF